MENKLKIVWTPRGGGIAIGVYAPNKSDGEQVFNVCYNYGAISQDAVFHSLKNDKTGFFGFFGTTWDELKKIKNIPIMKGVLPESQEQIDAAREDFFE